MTSDPTLQPSRAKQRRPADIARARSARLGQLRVVTDRTGTRILSEGILYAVHPKNTLETPAPWLALGAVPWLGSKPPDSVLLLGYGGGTLGRLLRRAAPRLRLEGVEPDPVMRRLAREHLSARVPGVRLHAMDAVAYLRHSGLRFDAVLDDIYAPIDGRLTRPHDVEELPRLARRRLRAGGLYAVSLASPGAGAERRTAASLARTFRYVLEISPWEYAHRILVGSERPFERGGVTRALNRLLGGNLASPAGVGLDRVRRLPGRRAAIPT